MFHIAICDENTTNFAILSFAIQSFFKQKELSANIRHCHSGEELLSLIKNGFCFDLIYLKIELKKQNGIEISDFIRNRQNDFITQIVFISAYSHHAIKLFQFQPTDFLLLPLEESRITQSLQAAHKRFFSNPPQFSFTFQNTIKKIPYSSILYFESDNRKIKLFHMNGTDIFYGKLDDIETKLEQRDFLRIHKSFLVNRNHILSVNSNYVYLDSEAVLPISRSRQKSFRQQI